MAAISCLKVYANGKPFVEGITCTGLVSSVVPYFVDLRFGDELILQGCSCLRQSNGVIND